MLYLDEFVIKFTIKLCPKIGILFFRHFLQILMMLPLIKNAKMTKKLIFQNPSISAWYG